MRLRILVAILMSSSLSGAACARPAPTPAPVTFNKDIAPILFANCAPCHRPGEVAPFSAADLRRRGETRRRDRGRNARAPHAAVAAGARRVPDSRRAAAARRSNRRHSALGERRQGRGRARAICRRLRSCADGWQLGRPDEVLTPAQPFTLEPDDRRRLPQPGPAHVADNRMSFVRGVEFKTGGAPIHHAVIRVDRTSGVAPARRRRRPARVRRHGVGHHPGSRRPLHRLGARAAARSSLPEGMPWRLDRGADLVVELHLIPSRKPLP